MILIIPSIEIYEMNQKSHRILEMTKRDHVMKVKHALKISEKHLL